MVPIGELVDADQVGREVYDAGGVTRVVAVKHNGVKPVWRVRLRNGSFVEATADHVVKAVAERRTAPTWLRVDELEVGMRMHLHPHRSKVAAPALVPAGGGWDDETGQSTGDPVAVAEAALAGWLQADGFVGQYEHGTNRSLTIEFQVSGMRSASGCSTTWIWRCPTCTVTFGRADTDGSPRRTDSSLRGAAARLRRALGAARSRHRDPRPAAAVDGFTGRDRRLPAQHLPGGRVRQRPARPRV